ncbi:hypothetical protein XPA_000939 [Xanthoria parietina]
MWECHARKTVVECQYDECQTGKTSELVKLKYIMLAKNPEDQGTWRETEVGGQPYSSLPLYSYIQTSPFRILSLSLLARSHERRDAPALDVIIPWPIRPRITFATSCKWLDGGAMTV